MFRSVHKLYLPSSQHTIFLRTSICQLILIYRLPNNSSILWIVQTHFMVWFFPALNYVLLFLFKLPSSSIVIYSNDFRTVTLFSCLAKLKSLDFAHKTKISFIICAKQRPFGRLWVSLTQVAAVVSSCVDSIAACVTVATVNAIRLLSLIQAAHLL